MFRAEQIMYRYHRAGCAVDGVSISVGPGETVGIVGESGSGKSTLARCLCGLIRPQSGAVSLDGHVLSTRSKANALDFRRQVQMVFQDPDLSLPRHLPVGVPLLDAARLQFHAAGVRLRHVVSLLDRLGLPPDALRRRPRELSGGQRQRVAIARALVVSPSVLLLDEPTSALDLSVQSQTLTLLSEVQAASGLSQILITHDISLALAYCDRLYVMEAGKVVETGDPTSVLSSPTHPCTQRLLNAMPSSDPTRRRLIQDVSA